MQDDLRPLEKRLRDAEQEVLQILHSSPVGISISRVRDGLIVDMNDEFLRLLGYTREEAVGRTSTELGLWVAPDQRAVIVAEFLERGRCGPRPVPMRCRDGTVVTVLFSASPLARGEEPHTVAWVIDVTERLRVEEALRASDEQWRLLFENAPAVITILDRAGTVLSVNQTITGRPKSEVEGSNLFPHLPESSRGRAREALQTVFRDHAPVTVRLPVAGPQGEPRWFVHRLAPMPDGRGGAAICVSMDITAQVAAEEALRGSEQRFRDIVQNLADWVWECDERLVVTYCSEQVAGKLGYASHEVVGRHLLFPAPEALREQGTEEIGGLLQRRQPLRERRFLLARRDGEPVVASVSAVPMFDDAGACRGYRGVSRDVTEEVRSEEERRRMEAEVHQARRVESLGVLAGGIAHDFNNLLTAILGNAELALLDLPAGSGAHALVEQIQAAGTHAADLTRQMLAYAGRGRLATERLDLSAKVREMSPLLASSIPKKVELALELAEGLPAVDVDAAQLRQVVMNLVLNAADAIGERVGRIEVRTGAPGGAFAADLAIGAIAAGAPTAYLEVADDGPGIDPAALARIFDPFFTTKFTGRGLGLAAVQGIVLRHGGTVAVRTRAGGGSVFRATFPAVAAEKPAAGPAGAGPAPAPAQQSAGAAWKGSGTLLLVDDEEAVRRMASRLLAALGFTVLSAADGREALEIAAASPQVRVVLLDLMMPRMDGRETFLELRRLRADLPVILCSGFAVEAGAGPADGLDFSGYLQKPYRAQDVAQALRRALGE